MGCDEMSWADCAKKTKKEINNATNAKQALEAYFCWAEKYRQIYDSQSNLPHPPSDIDRFEEFIEDNLPSWSTPIEDALESLIRKVFPKLAAALALASNPVVQSLWNLLVPSPIATDLQQAQIENAEIGQILFYKLNYELSFLDWRKKYDQIIRNWVDGGNIIHP